MPFTNTQTHKHTLPSFRSMHTESWHGRYTTGWCGCRPETFVNSPQQDLMILMTGSHHGGHVSQREMSEVKHVPSLLINSLATCCHLTLLGTAAYILPLLFLHSLSLSQKNTLKPSEETINNNLSFRGTQETIRGVKQRIVTAFDKTWTIKNRHYSRVRQNEGST